MTHIITSITPLLGNENQDTNITIHGTDFDASAVVNLVLPTSPPATYQLQNIAVISSTQITATVPANSISAGIYDVVVFDYTDSVTLARAYRCSPSLPADPFTNETIDVVRQRLLDRIDAKYNTTIGSITSDLLSPSSVEIARIYRRLPWILKQGFAQYMGGSLLELRCEEHGIIRNPATKSTVILEITAPVSTVIPTSLKGGAIGTANTGVPTVVFDNIEASNILAKTAVAGTLTSATSTSATDSGASWTANEWTNYYLIVTNPGNTHSQIVRVLSNNGTSNHVINIIGSWDSGFTPTTGWTYRLFTGAQFQSELVGLLTNVAKNTIKNIVSTTFGITSINNPLAASGGTDKEGDLNLLSRFLLAVRNPTSGGNIDDYKLWAKSVPGTSIGFVNIIPQPGAVAGAVEVVILNSDGTVPNSDIVTLVQNYIDPASAGLGYGKAPIGHTVTVATATIVTIAVSVALTIDSTYNSTLVKQNVSDAITAYLNSLNIGAVIYYTYIGYIVRNVPGVIDYDLSSGGHGIKKTGGGSWLTTNITMTTTEKPAVGALTIS